MKKNSSISVAGYFVKNARAIYNKMISSIAFYPALIAVGFLLLSWLMLELDFSEMGKHIKSTYNWVRLKDVSTARTIVTTIAAGIISLMVFSFSMVMILLNQAASQMSNRMLESMIGNRFQQLVLGFYIGTIVYALFLLSTVRDIESGIYVPALSIYLLLLVTIADIFIFIYFLHYVTQSVKFETIINRVHQQTLTSLKKNCTQGAHEYNALPSVNGQIILTNRSGYFQGIDKKRLLEFAGQYNAEIQLLHPPGTFLLEDQPVVVFYASTYLQKEETENLLLMLDFYAGQPINQNNYYGFHQLAEVALKALSPGVNDPQTAVLSLHALADLFQHRLKLNPELVLKDDHNEAKIFLKNRTFEDVFTDCIYPVWNYGKDDQYIQDALYTMLTQLLKAEASPQIHAVLNDLLSKVNSQIQHRNQAI